LTGFRPHVRAAVCSRTGTRFARLCCRRGRAVSCDLEVECFPLPLAGEGWVADTEVRGFGIRLWTQHGTTGCAYGVRFKNSVGKSIRKTFRPTYQQIQLAGLMARLAISAPEIPSYAAHFHKIENELIETEYETISAAIDANFINIRVRCCLKFFFLFWAPVSIIMSGKWSEISGNFWIYRPATETNHAKWDRIDHLHFNCLNDVRISQVKGGLDTDFWFPSAVNSDAHIRLRTH